MGVIHVLDEETVSHIAAGEVVERAASVVKELVENAIDADSSKITIDLAADKNAVTRISIADDGIGVSAEDAVLAFRQHATSKIQRPEDLDGIDTLGFRGEALASIAAVSKVTFTSKERGSAEPEAVQIVIHGGTLIRQGAAARSEGTTIVIEDLFYNTPARKKFQKSVATELSHIYDMVERLALAHRDVSIVLLFQGKERLRTYGTSAYPDVIAAVFGTGFAKDMTEVDGTFGLAKVKGYITRPGCDMRPTPTRFYLTINSRQVVSRPLQWAVREGYGTLLPKGMYPAAFLDIEVDPRDVDVNVHPTKKEVRLSREREVMMSVKDAVYSALHTEGLFSAKEEEEEDEDEDGDVRVSAPIPVQASLIQDYALPDTVAETRTPYPAAAMTAGLPRPIIQHRQTEKQLRRTEPLDVPETTENVLEVLGQIGGTYILARNAEGELVIIDQHAAHERVMYDRLLAKVALEQAGQELLVPVTLTLSRAESAAMPELTDTLAKAGYGIEPFGRDVWAVRSVPVISSTLGDPQVIHEILAEAAGAAEKNPERVLDRVIKTAACRAVVKGNTELTFEQMRRLLRQLAATASPYTCPHGRPTTIVLTKEKLAAMFLRT